MVAVSPFFTARSTLTRRLLRSAISLRRALTSAAMTFTSARGLQTLVLAQRHLGIHRHGALKDHAVLAAGLQLHLGIAHDLQLLLLHGGLIGVGQHDIHSLLVKDLSAVHPSMILRGALPGRKPGTFILPRICR